MPSLVTVIVVPSGFTFPAAEVVATGTLVKYWLCECVGLVPKSSVKSLSLVGTVGIVGKSVISLFVCVWLDGEKVLGLSSTSSQSTPVINPLSFCKSLVLAGIEGKSVISLLVCVWLAAA